MLKLNISVTKIKLWTGRGQAKKTYKFTVYKKVNASDIKKKKHSTT